MRERGGVEDALGRVQSAEPAEQEVRVEPLHELALTADRVEALKQQRLEQHLRRDAGAPHVAVRGREERRERSESTESTTAQIARSGWSGRMRSSTSKSWNMGGACGQVLSCAHLRATLPRGFFNHAESREVCSTLLA